MSVLCSQPHEQDAHKTHWEEVLSRFLLVLASYIAKSKYASVNCSLRDKGNKKLGQRLGILPYTLLLEIGFRESHLLRSPRR